MDHNFSPVPVPRHQSFADPSFEVQKAHADLLRGDTKAAEAEFKAAIADADALPDALHTELHNFLAVNSARARDSQAKGPQVADPNVKDSQGKDFQGKVSQDKDSHDKDLHGKTSQADGKVTAEQLNAAFVLDHSSFYTRMEYGDFLQAEHRNTEAQNLFDQANKLDPRLYARVGALQTNSDPTDSVLLTDPRVLLKREMSTLWTEGKEWGRKNEGSIAAMGAGVAVGAVMSWSGPGAIATALATSAAVGAALGTGADAAAGDLKNASAKTVALDLLKHGFEGAGGAAGPAIYMSVGAALGLSAGEVAASSAIGRYGLMGLRGAATFGGVSLLNRSGRLIEDYENGLYANKTKGDMTAYLVGGSLSDATWGFFGGTGLRGLSAGAGFVRGVGIETVKEGGFKDSKRILMHGAEDAIIGFGTAQLFRFVGRGEQPAAEGAGDGSHISGARVMRTFALRTSATKTEVSLVARSAADSADGQPLAHLLRH